MKETKLSPDPGCPARKASIQKSSPANSQSKVGEPVPLSVQEKTQLAKCEHVLWNGLNTFFEVGSALLTIREARLYRMNYINFEAYCHERWGIGRSYAWRVIGAAERLRLLPSGENRPRPSNEFQMRPFLKLQPEAFPQAWEQVLARAKDGKITPKLVRGLVAEITLGSGKLAKVGRHPKRFRFSRTCLPGELLVLLQEAKREIETSKPEQAIATLERLEKLIFGPSVSSSDGK